MPEESHQFTWDAEHPNPNKGGYDDIGGMWPEAWGKIDSVHDPKVGVSNLSQFRPSHVRTFLTNISGAPHTAEPNGYDPARLSPYPRKGKLGSEIDGYMVPPGVKPIPVSQTAISFEDYLDRNRKFFSTLALADPAISNMPSDTEEQISVKNEAIEDRARKFGHNQWQKTAIATMEKLNKIGYFNTDDPVDWLTKFNPKVRAAHDEYMQASAEGGPGDPDGYLFRRWLTLANILARGSGERLPDKNGRIINTQPESYTFNENGDMIIQYNTNDGEDIYANGLNTTVLNEDDLKGIRPEHYLESRDIDISPFPKAIIDNLALEWSAAVTSGNVDDLYPKAGSAPDAGRSFMEIIGFLPPEQLDALFNHQSMRGDTRGDNSFAQTIRLIHTLNRLAGDNPKKHQMVKASLNLYLKSKASLLDKTDQRLAQENIKNQNEVVDYSGHVVDKQVLEGMRGTKMTNNLLDPYEGWAGRFRDGVVGRNWVSFKTMSNREEAPVASDAFVDFVFGVITQNSLEPKGQQQFGNNAMDIEGWFSELFMDGEVIATAPHKDQGLQNWLGPKGGIHGPENIRYTSVDLSETSLNKIQFNIVGPAKGWFTGLVQGMGNVSSGVASWTPFDTGRFEAQTIKSGRKDQIVPSSGNLDIKKSEVLASFYATENALREHRSYSVPRLAPVPVLGVTVPFVTKDVRELGGPTFELGIMDQFHITGRQADELKALNAYRGTFLGPASRVLGAIAGSMTVHEYRGNIVYGIQKHVYQLDLDEDDHFIRQSIGGRNNVMNHTDDGRVPMPMSSLRYAYFFGANDQTFLQLRQFANLHYSGSKYSRASMEFLKQRNEDDYRYRIRRYHSNGKIIQRFDTEEGVEQELFIVDFKTKQFKKTRIPYEAYSARDPASLISRTNPANTESQRRALEKSGEGADHYRYLNYIPKHIQEGLPQPADRRQRRAPADPLKGKGWDQTMGTF